MTGPEPPVPGEGWPLGADGVPFRRAARVLLFDPMDRALLVRGHDPHQVERSWWFTIGGGIDAGEPAREAAVREVVEETGIALDPARLVGPVARRRAVAAFAARTVHQHEVFYLARLDRAVPVADLHREGWTDNERSFMDELAWWHPEALAAQDLEVFPAELVDLLCWVRPGWDGTVRELGPL